MAFILFRTAKASRHCGTDRVGIVGSCYLRSSGSFVVPVLSEVAEVPLVNHFGIAQLLVFGIKWPVLLLVLLGYRESPLAEKFFFLPLYLVELFI